MARLPEPERPPSVALYPARLRHPPLRTTVEFCNAAALPSCSVPAAIVVGPVYALLPLKRSVLPPSLARAMPPPMGLA